MYESRFMNITIEQACKAYCKMCDLKKARCAYNKCVAYAGFKETLEKVGTR